jgi:hypothetical protein
LRQTSHLAVAHQLWNADVDKLVKLDSSKQFSFLTLESRIIAEDTKQFAVFIICVVYLRLFMLNNIQQEHGDFRRAVFNLGLRFFLDVMPYSLIGCTET